MYISCFFSFAILFEADLGYEGIEAYKTYLAIKNHFKTSYDYFKYNGRVKVTNESFLKRRDKYFFAKLERRYKKNELVYFFVANFMKDEGMWSGSLHTSL